MGEGADEPLSQALLHMTTGKVRALPVLDRQTQLAGLLTVEDVNEAYRLLLANPNPAHSP